MTTELERGGIFTKIKIKGYLNDLTNNSSLEIDTTAIKNNKKITYYLEKDKYTIKIISPTSLILKRENNDIDTILCFELNKEIPATYNIKENQLSININIKTHEIQISEQFIKIYYTVTDSNNKFEYYIEMSETK